MGLFFLLALVILLEVGCLVFILVFAYSSTRRFGRAGSLWILALAARRGGSLIHELQNFARSLSFSEAKRIDSLIFHINTGQPFGQALLHTPGVVPHETAILAAIADEHSADIATLLASESARMVKRRDTILSASVSPGILILHLLLVPIVLATILTGLMIFIVPKLRKIFSDFGSQLPKSATTLFAIGDWFGQMWYLFIPPVALILSVILIKVLFQTTGRPAPWRKLPIWPSSRRVRASLALRAVAIAVRQNIPIESVLQSLARQHPLPSDARAFRALSRRLATAEDPWSALQAARLISKQNAEFLRGAAATGNLPWAVQFLIVELDDHANQRLAVRLELLQPALVVLMGLIVGFVCFATYFPLVKLINDLS